MEAISKTNFKCIFLNRIFILWLQWHWILFPRVKLTNNIGSHNDSAPNLRQIIFWPTWWSSPVAHFRVTGPQYPWHSGTIYIRWGSIKLLWRHQMETFSTLLALCEGNPPGTGRFPSQRASNADLWCYFIVSPNKQIKKTRLARNSRRYDGHLTSPWCFFLITTVLKWCFVVIISHIYWETSHF